MVNPAQSKGPMRKTYYVVRFTEELQDQHVDKYVCLPYNWICLVKSDRKTAVAAYPRAEHPNVTRQRVQKREKFEANWHFPMAIIEQDFDTYDEAQIWIARRNYEENSQDFKDPEPSNEVVQKFTKRQYSTPSTKPNENNSSNRPGPSKQMTIDNTIRLTDTDDINVANITEEYFKTFYVRNLAAKIVTPSVSNTMQPTLSKNSDESFEKCLSMPSLDDNDVIVDQEIQPESIATRRSSSAQSSPHTPEQQCQLPFKQERYYPNEDLVEQFNNQYLRKVTATKPKPVSDKGQKTDTNSNTITAHATHSKTTANRSTKLNQSTPLPHPKSSEVLYWEFKLRKLRGERFTEEFHNDKESNHQVISNIPCSSQNLPNPQIAKKEMSSLPMFPVGNQTKYHEIIPPDNTHSIQSNINNQGFMFPNTAQSSLIDKRHITTSAVNHADLETCHQDNIAETSTSQNHSNSAYQLRWSMQPLNIHQNLPHNKNNSGLIPQAEDISRLPSDNKNTHQNLTPFDMMHQILGTLQPNMPRQSIENPLRYHTDQRPQTRNGLDETSTVTNPACLPNKLQLLQQKCVQNSTQESRNPITKGQKPGLQAVTKNTPPVASKSANSLRQSPQSVQRRNLMLDPRIQRRLNERSTVQNHKAGPILPQYIMTEPIPTTSNFETLRTSIRESHETHNKPDYQSPMYVNTPTFKLVDRATQTAKRVGFKEGIVESPAMKRPRMVLNGVTQADVSLPNNTQHKFVSGLNSVLNDEDVADNETTAEETPFVRNNAESTPLAINSTVEPTYDQYKLSKIKASSEVLEAFAKFDACFGKMVSNLSNMCNSFLNMQSFVHQSVKQMEGRVKAYHDSL